MAGKVITCSLSTMDNFEADLKYFIVLRPGKVKVSGMKHRPDLAPSSELFGWTQAHKHEENWFEEYERRFCHDIHYRKGLSDAIAEIGQKAKTQTVMLVCFCPDVNRCHRGLIADELINRGVEVSKH
jgi:uncharacterized protein YeaO (DUF488 family)